MTSLAFTSACCRWSLATGAGSASQRAIGTGVMGGMITRDRARGLLRAGVLRRRAPHLQGQRTPAADVRPRGRRRRRADAAVSTPPPAAPAGPREAIDADVSTPWPSRDASRRAALAARSAAGCASMARTTSGRRRRCDATFPGDETRPALPAAPPPPTSSGSASSPTRGCKRLIGIALENNRDLRVAVLTIEQARALYQIRRADELPTVGVGAQRRAPAGRQRRRRPASTPSGSASPPTSSTSSAASGA